MALICRWLHLSRKPILYYVCFQILWVFGLTKYSAAHAALTNVRICCGSLGHWENYHRTIIQDQIQIQIQDQVHIRVTIKPEKTAKKTPPIRAGLKLTLLGF